MKYYPPIYEAKDFHCPRCSVYAHQHWAGLIYVMHGDRHGTKASVSRCGHCDGLAYWYENKLILPAISPVEMPSADLPEDCMADYLEARDIVSASPKGAVALLRLCVQKLMIHLGEPGKNINSDIASLVKAGLPPLIQKSLDICRVVGNNAVHPGEIVIDDTPEIAHSLFRLINVIVEDRISRPYMVRCRKAPERLLKNVMRHNNRIKLVRFLSLERCYRSAPYAARWALLKAFYLRCGSRWKIRHF